MRLLFITDTHLRVNAPRSRVDNFQETLIRKMNEIGRIIKKRKIEYLLHGGDLFDRPDAPIRSVTLFTKVLQSYQIPIFIISGNHDIYGQNPETVERSMLGLLSALKIVHLIDNQSIFLEQGDLVVQIHGTPYRYDIDRDVENYNFHRDNKTDVAIQMVHSFLLEKPFIKGIYYTLIDDLAESQADLILSGHYHTGYGIVKRGNKLFANPGSVVRTNNSKQEQARLPKVLFIEIEKGDGSPSIYLEEIELQVAQPGIEVLSRAQSEQSRMRQEQMEQFKQTVRENIDLSSYDILDILRHLSSSHHIEKDIVQESIRRLQNAAYESGEDDV